MYINDMREEFVAIIGMPRSFSTIVTSVANSIDGAFFISEPYHGVNAKRPKLFSGVPILSESRYGMVAIHPNRDVMMQVQKYAQRFGTSLYGFKECWNPWLDPIELVEENWSKIHRVVVTVRDPRKNLASMLSVSGQSISAETFETEYSRFMAYIFARDGDKVRKVRPLIVDKFLEDPMGSLSEVLEQEILGDLVLQQFTGGGDVDARFAKEVKLRDKREPYAGDDIKLAIDAYNRILNLGP